MVFLAVASNILDGGRDLQVGIADPSAIPGLYGVFHHLQVLAGVIGIDLCRLLGMRIDIIRGLDMDFDNLFHQIGLIAYEIATDHQAAAGMPGGRRSK